MIEGVRKEPLRVDLMASSMAPLRVRKKAGTTAYMQVRSKVVMKTLGHWVCQSESVMEAELALVVAVWAYVTVHLLCWLSCFAES